ncbi:hypothetical protein SAMN04488102_103130 [Alkalibacterium subtropicum]|uniref:C4-dicarboxylate ABC transporter n=1 Tax=Alkalibacterium subtropicum TaxID=753702 RepID=A0A1I1GKG4_9LACT|nr:DUF308 domain-containing protein [Alkalibacterium subtropicum]SFC12249.1 hypothetical protein SAMN04488102_103130 [Alkalibacterium subtropicum]
MGNNSLSKTKGMWLGIIGIFAAVLGYFTFQMPLGFLAIVLGIIGLASPQKTLNWIAIVLGTIVLVLGII